MNREWVSYQLGEASEELTRTIEEIRNREDYDVGELMVAMMHMYLHLNTAWNARDASPEDIADMSQETFKLWSQYPSDLPRTE